mgnify:CR=1 FL=1
MQQQRGITGRLLLQHLQPLLAQCYVLGQQFIQLPPLLPLQGAVPQITKQQRQ